MSLEQRAVRYRWLLLLAWLLLTALVCNSLRDLIQPDEGRYAEIPRQMLATGDWIVPQLNGLPYVEKPPLQYWATAAAYALFGVHDWVSRLWNLLLGIAGVVAVGAAGHRLFGARAGWYAALILMSAPLYLLVGQVNLLDMGVTFFLSAALLCFVLAQQDQASTAQRWRWMLLCWSALGLGFLQKGLEALAVPGVALVAYTVLRRDATLWGRLHLGAGLAVLAVWVLPWNVLLALRDGRYAEFFLIHEHFTRFLTTEHQRVQPFWYFGAVLVGACLPWTGLMLQSAWSALRSRTRVGAPGSLHFDVPLALAVWAATVVVFFSLSGSKLVPYIMPCVPPLALLAGRALALREDSRSAAPGLRPVCVLSMLLALALLAAPPVAVALVKNAAMLPVYRGMAPYVTAAGLIVLCGAVLAAMWLRISAPIGRALLALSLALHMACLVLVTGGNALADARGAPGAAAELAVRLQPMTPFYCVGTYLHVLSFQLQRSCTLVEYTGELQVQFSAGVPLDFAEFSQRWSAQPGAVALVVSEWLPRLQAAHLPVQVLVAYPDHSLVVHP